MLADPTAPPQNYWANTGGNIIKNIRQELTYRDVDDSVDDIWSVLYATGYPTGKHVENADALKQIEEKRYDEGLKYGGMKKIIRYGMAFCGKECMVVVE